MMLIKPYIFIAFLFLSVSTYAQRISFDKYWKFIQKDVPDAQQIGFNDAHWRVLDLPHDWSIEGSYDKNNPMGDQCGYLPAGIGWYRKTIVVPKSWKSKHVEIAFDGVYMNSTVWANGEKLGVRPYGWVSFAYDISKQAQTADSITFAVRVDNSLQPSARWYTGSGIYAHTWLRITNEVHVVDNGIFVRTQGSTATVSSEIVNNTPQSKSINIKTTIVDANGKVIKGTNTIVKMNAGESRTADQHLTTYHPRLWSVDNPNLYTLVTEVFDGKKLLDQVKTRFGFRDIEWKPKTGMWINGKNLKLQGVADHQGAGALGAAVPDKILRFRIEQLKKMGCNAILTAHNAQTPVFYEICDEEGMLVMDEFFDGWGKKAAYDYGEQAFAEWWRKDLSDLVKRDRNHPSVVIYSVGNETKGAVAKDLVATCHQYDSTRPVTSGDSEPQYMDVYGVNGSSEMLGWFKTLPTDRVFIATENPHTWQVRGYYRTQTWYRDGYPNEKRKPYYIPDLTKKEIFFDDWVKDEGRGNSKQIFNSSYDNATVRLTARHSIQQLRDIPNYAGGFRWTGYDYIGEASYVHGGWPFKSFMGGAIDMANFEKDLYYLYQSQWTKKPMVHILPHWTHPKMKLGTKIPVWVYSNCDEVELFFNGKTLGKIKPGKQWDKMQCQWMVPWKPGQLKVIGYKNGKQATEETIRTANAPAHIVLSVDGKPLATQGKDIVQVRITATDAKGEFYPYGENRTYFHVIGPAKIRALDNGSPIDDEKHFEASNRIAFYGLTRAYVESTEKPGSIALLASCILGEKKLITSNLVNIDTKLIALRGKLPKASVEVFYTVDGSTPTRQSTPYTKAFSISLGTTVKALVILNGKPVQVLTERFAQDEGFVWNNNHQKVGIIGEQAEDAKFKDAEITNSGVGFNGKAYLKFADKIGAYVEWYQENDGSAGKADLWIRYSTEAAENKGTFLRLTVNGKVVDDKLFVENTSKLGAVWKMKKVAINLQKGANTIRLTTIESTPVYIDEIRVQ